MIPTTGTMGNTNTVQLYTDNNGRFRCLLHVPAKWWDTMAWYPVSPSHNDCAVCIPTPTEA